MATRMSHEADTYTYREATIIQHCAVVGRLEQRVRAYRIGAVRPEAQHPVSVCVAFIEPRKRRAYAFSMRPDNLTYLTIEVDGQVVYDSRADVPCDMTKWDAANRDVRERLARSRSRRGDDDAPC